ncbi:MAG: tyrosine-type recombinase/integrase [Bacteroidota bacterium]
MRKDFEAYLKSRQYSRKTIETYLNSFKLYMEWLEKENIELEQVSYNDLLLYVKHSGKTASPRGLKGYMLVVKHLYSYLLSEGKVNQNPAIDIEVKGVKRKVLYHILEPYELHQLYNTFKAETPSERRKQVILGLLIYQGLKTEELRKLDREHVKLREGKIEVPGGIRSNGRTLQLESHQVMDLYDYTLQVRPELLAKMPQPNETLLAISKNSGNISNLTTELFRKLKEVNPNVLNTKQIRASVITKWIKMYNLREVQYLAGHRYISSTEWYIENDLEGLKEEINQFHPLG